MKNKIRVIMAIAILIIVFPIISMAITVDDNGIMATFIREKGLSQRFRNGQ